MTSRRLHGAMATRRSRAVPGVGLVVALWTWLALPALHVIEHARQSEPSGLVAIGHGFYRPARVQAIIDQALGRAAATPAPGPRHSHGPDGSGDDRRQHGGGTLQHLGVAFLDAPTFVLAPCVQVAAELPPPALISHAAALLGHRPSARGPPSLCGRL